MTYSYDLKRHGAPLILAILLLGASLSASARELSIDQLYHSSWTTRDGAPGDIRSLAQTSDGFLWLGTIDGLFRFDGVRFERWIARTGEPLASEAVDSLLATPDGGLWIGSGRDGVSLLKNGRLTNYGKPQGFTARTVHSLAQDTAGNIWAAAAGDGLYRFDGSNWQAIKADWNFVGDAWTDLVDKSGTLWVGNSHGVYFLLKGATKFQQLTPLPVMELMAVTDGVLIGFEFNGTFRLVSTSCQKTLPPPPVDSASNVLLDSHGALWMGSWKEGLRRTTRADFCTGSPTVTEHFSERDKLSGDNVRRILEDGEGNIWVATNKGLDSFRESAVVPVATPSGLSHFTLTPLAQGDVRVTTEYGGNFRIHDGKTVDFAPNDIGTSSSFLDASGTIWMGSLGDNNIRELAHDKVTLHPAPGAVYSITKDSAQGLLAMVLNKGIWHFTNGLWTKDPTLGVGGSASFADAAGRTWVGFHNGDVVQLTGGAPKTYSGASSPQIGAIQAIHGNGSDVHLWFGGEKGFSMFDGQRYFTIKPVDAPSFGNVSGVVASKTHGIWLAQSRGIVQIDEAEVRAIEKDPSRRATYRVYDSDDGLLESLQGYFPGPTAAEGEDGIIWFATAGGIVWIDPQHIPTNPLPPPVSIRSVTANGRTIDAAQAIVLPAGTRNLQVDYTALSLTDPGKVRFKYQLAGTDATWTDAGGRRQAFYTDLKPGAYRFHVIASNNDGVWNNDGASIELKIRPMFYQTSAFIALCVVVAAAIAWLIYLARIRHLARNISARLEERMNAQLEERTRIARDLHDSLLQGFLGLNFQLQAARNVMSDNPIDAARILDSALDRNAQAITEARETIEGLRLSNLGLDLPDSLVAVTAELSSSAAHPAPSMSVSTEGEPREIRAHTRGEVYAIAREALRNAFQHGQAAHIQAQLAFRPEGLSLCVQDDGIGIEDKVLALGRTDHFGLSGMRERARRIGGQLEVKTSSGQGTCIDLFVPALIAYDD